MGQLLSVDTVFLPFMPRGLLDNVPFPEVVSRFITTPNHTHKTLHPEPRFSTVTGSTGARVAQTPTGRRDVDTSMCTIAG